MNQLQTQLSSYPKVYNLGHKAIEDIWLGKTVIQEKIDGSQFSFGIINGNLMCRSKGKDQTYPDSMFARAVSTVQEIAGNLTPNWIYRGEYLSNPKHNTIKYDRVPKGNIILFDIEVNNGDFMAWDYLISEATKLGLESVSYLGERQAKPELSEFHSWLELESCLGGSKIEGVVVKNYGRWGVDGKVLMGKFVSEAFKEMHEREWGKSNPSGKDVVTLIGESLKTEARWEKAIQHLGESGAIEGDPRDIGPLMKEINIDVMTECEDLIKDELFKWAWPQISRTITRGFPQWYKEKLLEKSLE